MQVFAAELIPNYHFHCTQAGQLVAPWEAPVPVLKNNQNSTIPLAPGDATMAQNVAVEQQDLAVPQKTFKTQLREQKKRTDGDVHVHVPGTSKMTSQSQASLGKTVEQEENVADELAKLEDQIVTEAGGTASN